MRKIKKQDPNEPSKKKKWGLVNVLKTQAMEFCRETGLHGYKYIGQSQRSKIERIAWAIAVFASLCCAMVLMKFAWIYYSTHPILTVIESTHHGIWNYPFPAVTVCDINRVSLNLSRKLVDNLKLPPNISKDFVVGEMKLLNELLYPGRYGYNIERNLSELQNIIDYNRLSISTVVNLVTRDCGRLLTACKWKHEVRECSEIFEKSLTRDGLCCSFNYITRENILKNKNIKPGRVTACGHQTGVAMLLNFEPEDYHATILGSRGIKIMLHDPYNYPDHNAASTIVGIDQYTFVTVKPEEIHSTKNVRNLALRSRDCIFADETSQIQKTNKMQNFTAAKYSYVNCMTKCRTTIIRAKCGCIPYYYPQESTRACNLKDVGCLRRYREWYDTSWPITQKSTTKIKKSFRSIKERPCNCMPDCNFYRYYIESSEGKLDKNIYHQGLEYTRRSTKGKAWKDNSVVHVYFGDLISIQYRRNVHYNWRNLFASFGGLLGLFAGFSLMSVFELVYFFVIRVITDAYRRKVNKESIRVSK